MPPALTEGLEDVGGGLIYVVGVGLVALGAVLHPLALLLVAGLATVAPPPVVALGNVHANVHSVVTCQDIATRRVGSLEKGQRVRLSWKQEITLILMAINLYHQVEGQKETRQTNNWNWLI